MRLRQLALAAALLALASGSASAQNYPNRPIRVLVPFAAGGAVDTLARLIGQKLSEGLGQPVIIENRPGAGGNLASDVLAKAPPDGYTVLQTVNGLSISPSLYKTLPFNVEKDFIAVTQIVQSQLLLVANPKLEANNVAELIRLAKSKPGALNYGSTGVGNPLSLTMAGMDANCKVVSPQANLFQSGSSITTVPIIPLDTQQDNVRSLHRLRILCRHRNAQLLRQRRGLFGVLHLRAHVFRRK